MSTITPHTAHMFDVTLGPGMREMLAPKAFVGGTIGLVHEGSDAAEYAHYK